MDCVSVIEHDASHGIRVLCCATNSRDILDNTGTGVYVAPVPERVHEIEKLFDFKLPPSFPTRVPAQGIL